MGSLWLKPLTALPFVHLIVMMVLEEEEVFPHKSQLHQQMLSETYTWHIHFCLLLSYGIVYILLLHMLSFAFPGNTVFILNNYFFKREKIISIHPRNFIPGSLYYFMHSIWYDFPSA